MSLLCRAARNRRSGRRDATSSAEKPSDCRRETACSRNYEDERQRPERGPRRPRSARRSHGSPARRRRPARRARAARRGRPTPGAPDRAAPSRAAGCRGYARAPRLRRCRRPRPSCSPPRPEPHVGLPRHLTGSRRDLLRERLGGRHDDDLGHGSSCPSEIGTSPVQVACRRAAGPAWASARRTGTARAPGAAIGPAPHERLVVVEEEPIDITWRSWATGGTIILSTTTGRWRTPSMWGIEWPYTSASRTPTDWPSCKKVAARLTVRVDSPTPPFPLATAITRVDASTEIPFDRCSTPPRSRCVSAAFSSVTSRRRRARPSRRPAARRHGVAPAPRTSCGAGNPRRSARS